MQTRQPARAKLVLRSSHRTLRLGISHGAAASTPAAPARDAHKPAPARPPRR